jgi:predicted enzyme related to lactoylglutathione lyase
MRVDIYLPTKNTEQSIHFFVDQLNLFNVIKDHGMGNVLLQCAQSPEFHLMLSPDDSVRNNSALFSISVKDCEKELQKILGIKFEGNAGVLRDSAGNPELIEYALGKFFKIQDPAGNIFTVYEWFVTS